MNREKRILDYKILLIIYTAIMLYLLFFGDRIGIITSDYWENVKYHLQYKPFGTIKSYVYAIKNGVADWGVYKNLFGNVLVFVPLGLLLTAIWRRFRKFGRFFFTAFLIIFSVETAQLFSLRGYFDVDDIILNLFGSVLGFLIAKPFRRLRRKIDDFVENRKEVKAD